MEDSVGWGSAVRVWRCRVGEEQTLERGERVKRRPLIVVELDQVDFQINQNLTGKLDREQGARARDRREIVFIEVKVAAQLQSEQQIDCG